MKKGQVTLFILVGIVLVIAVAVILTLKTKVSSESNYEIATNFEAQKIQLASQIKTCIKIETKEAVDIYGLNGWSSGEEIEYYIENKLDDCIAFEDFERQGLNIKKEDIDATANVSGDYLFINVNYPMVLSNRMAESEIEDFIYSMEINKEKYIPTENGFVKEDTIIELKDAGIKIEISRGTEITEASTSRLSVETTGKDILQVYFDVNVANKIYNIGPDNAKLSKPARITINYDENMLPEGVTADDLSIVYYDEEQNRWVSVDTIIDKNNKVASANIEHFSVYSLAWIIEYQERFFTGIYANNQHQFCEDIKNDLKSHLDDIVRFAVEDIPYGSAEYKHMTGTNIFSESVNDAISQGTCGIVKVFKGEINDLIDLSSSSTRRLFFNKGGNYIDILDWCINLPDYKKEYGLGDNFINFCKASLDYCFRGETVYAPNCDGITSIDELYYTCRKKASVLEREYSDEVSIEVDGETRNFGPDECQAGGNGMCLSGIRCYDDLHLCYLFPTENPEEQICPEGRVLTINWCPQGNNVRCCKRPEFVEVESGVAEADVEAQGIGKLWASDVRITKYYTPYEGDFSNWYDFYEDVKMQGSGIGLNGCLYRYYSIMPTKEESPYECNNMRGITASGTNPTVRRTIAAPPEIPLGTKLFIDFGPGYEKWSGVYTAEDRGGAVKNSLDFYSGVGKVALNSIDIADHADVYMTT